MIYNENFYTGRQSILIAQIEFITPLLSLLLSLIYGVATYLKRVDLVYLYILFIATIILIQFLIISIL